MREGIREVFSDPALLLIEIGWRWSFGAIAALVFLLSTFQLLGNIKVDAHGLEALGALNPSQLGQQMAATLAVIGAALFRVGAAAGSILTVFWIVVSALGRHATLARRAFTPGASLLACLAISLSRALVTVACGSAWLLATVLAAFIASSISRDALPNISVVSAFSLMALLLIASVWSASNWFLSLASLFAGDRWQCLTDVVKLIRSCREELLEISIVSTAIRVALLTIAFLLSFAVAAAVTNPRILAADLLAIALLYFLVADFLYVARLVAFARLRTAIPEPLERAAETAHEPHLAPAAR